MFRSNQEERNVFFMLTDYGKLLALLITKLNKGGVKLQFLSKAIEGNSPESLVKRAEEITGIHCNEVTDEAEKERLLSSWEKLVRSA